MLIVIYTVLLIKKTYDEICRLKFFNLLYP